MKMIQIYLSIIPVLILYLILISSSCSEDNPVVPPPPEPPKAVALSLVDVSCTEAFIKVTAADSVLPLSISLSKDNSTIANFTLSKTDTVVIDTTLQPNITYVYQTIAQISGKEEKSDTLQVKTLALTSHNFTWQTFTFGNPDFGSSGLNDVAIIDESNIWAVGEIYNDTTGQAYNAVHWDGSNWELRRIYFPTVCASTDSTPYPAISIFAFDNGEIWISSSGDKIAILENGIQIDKFCLPSNVSMSINKIWGSSSNDLYVVGNGGNIAHYQNGSWSKIESGTTTNLNDVWGYYDKDNNEKSVLTVASNVFHTGEYRLLAISGNSASDTLNWTYTDWLTGVWFLNRYSPLYVCGDGVKVYKNNQWSVINLPYYFTEAIRGDNYNNIIVVGDFGFATHFNGLSWQTLDELSGQGRFAGVAVKGGTVVICGNNSSGGIVGNAIIIVGNQ